MDEQRTASRSPVPGGMVVGAADLGSGRSERDAQSQVVDRRIVAQRGAALHAQRVRALAPVIRDATLREIENGSGPTPPWQLGRPFDALAAAHAITLRVINMEQHQDEMAAELAQIVRDALAEHVPVHVGTYKATA